MRRFFLSDFLVRSDVLSVFGIKEKNNRISNMHH